MKARHVIYQAIDIPYTDFPVSRQTRPPVVSLK